MKFKLYIHFYGHTTFKRVVSVTQECGQFFTSDKALTGNQLIESPSGYRDLLLAQQKYCLAIGIAWLAKLFDSCKTFEDVYLIIEDIFMAHINEKEKSPTKIFPEKYCAHGNKTVNVNWWNKLASTSSEDFLESLDDINEVLSKKSGMFIFYWFFEISSKNYAHTISFKRNIQNSVYTILNPCPNEKVISKFDSIIDANKYIHDFLEKQDPSNCVRTCIKALTVERERFSVLK